MAFTNAHTVPYIFVTRILVGCMVCCLYIDAGIYFQ
jgi:hypothetical protein